MILKEKRAENTGILSMFDSKYRKREKKDMSLPSEILAFKLLKKANITKEESYWYWLAWTLTTKCICMRKLNLP